MTSIATKLGAILVGGALLCASGCGTPNRVNIELRKQIQTLKSQNNQLRQEHAGDQRVIAGLQSRQGSLPTLPPARLAELFTTHGLEFSRLTGGADLDPNKPGDEGIAIYIVPTDQTGDKLKAAGTFDVDVFDLAETASPLVGHWHFDLQQSKSAWTSAFIEYNYVLMCPWQKGVPRHPDITVKVTFFDLLTQTPFTAQRVVHVNLPPAGAGPKN